MTEGRTREREGDAEGKGKKKELQPKVNQVTLFLPTAFRQCAKIAVKQKLRPVTQSHSSLSTSTLTAGPRHGAQEKKRRSWMAASRPRRLRGLGSQLETACLPSGMQLDALDCFFCCSHTLLCHWLRLHLRLQLRLRVVVRLCIGAGTTIQISLSPLVQCASVMWRPALDVDVRPLGRHVILSPIRHVWTCKVPVMCVLECLLLFDTATQCTAHSTQRTARKNAVFSTLTLLHFWLLGMFLFPTA